MATGPFQSSRIADFKQGQYNDGHPLDEVQYLETSDTDRVELVNQTIVEEVLQDLGKLCKSQLQ
jgi:hypothetical protein